jgi:hypothetical protein
MAITRAVGADVTRVIIKGVDIGQVTGAIRLEHGERLYDINVDVAAALALALHLGLPIYTENLDQLREDRLEALGSAKDPSSGPQIPQAFRRVIEAMELPEGDGENLEGCDND